MKTPKGHQGSWFADWDGEKLPCVHLHWTKDIWPSYDDAGFDNRKKWEQFVHALAMQKKAILTSSHPPDDNGKRRRKSYIAVYNIDDVRAEGGHLRFTFREPIVRFRNA